MPHVTALDVVYMVLAIVIALVIAVAARSHSEHYHDAGYPSLLSFRQLTKAWAAAPGVFTGLAGTLSGKIVSRFF